MPSRATARIAFLVAGLAIVGVWLSGLHHSSLFWGFLLSAALGAGTGASEIISRYRDEPIRAVANRYGLNHSEDGQDYPIGPAIVIETFLRMLDRKIGWLKQRLMAFAALTDTYLASSATATKVASSADSWFRKLMASVTLQTSIGCCWSSSTWRRLKLAVETSGGCLPPEGAPLRRSGR